MEIPPTHPRYESLKVREKLVLGVKEGIVTPSGLIAHGRGEAFDYLLGERTTPEAEEATRRAAAHLLSARHPVLSVNGNVAALVPEGVAQLQREVPLTVEVNLFHRTEERVVRIVRWLEEHGCRGVLGEGATPLIPGLDSERGKSTPEGVAGADVVLIPLEDGDRAQALRRMGKIVLAIDLNPLSRTSLAATVSITDNLLRALPNLLRHLRKIRESGISPSAILSEPWSNEENLRSVLRRMVQEVEKTPLGSSFPIGS